MITEFKNDNYRKLFDDNNLSTARLLSWSKSTYRNNHPDDLIMFNANILAESKGKIWYGDININLDKNDLQNIADILGEDLYVLYETDCRFENENKSIDELINKAVVTINYQIKPAKLDL